MAHNSFQVHRFYDIENIPFCPQMYSQLKFGSDAAAKSMGYELANAYFAAHMDVLIANRSVVIPSPYNHIKNAATVMTHHFVDRLNELLVNACGKAVEYSIIHRKVSYIKDYGYLSKAKRKGLIDNDSFYLNREFLVDKHLIFVDDVKITGTHEDKLIEILDREKIDNECHFLYYAQYGGQSPSIEAEINFAGMKSADDFIEMTKQPKHHVLIRPIKYVLGQKPDELARILTELSDDTLHQMYYGSLAEGYFKIPSYQTGFNLMVAEKQKRSVK